MAKDTIVDVCCAVEFSLSQVAEVTVFLLEMLAALSDFILYDFHHDKSFPSALERPGDPALYASFLLVPGFR